MAVVKELVRLVQTFCGYVQRELKLFNEIYEDNSSAVKHADPEFIASIKGRDTVLLTSGNVKSGCIKTTSQEKKNKKPYSANKTSAANKANGIDKKSHLGARQPRGEEQISSKASFRGTERVTPHWTPNACPLYTDVKKQKGTSCNLARNSPRVNKHLQMKPPPVRELIIRNDGFLRASIVTPVARSTLDPWRLHSDINSGTTLTNALKFDRCMNNAAASTLLKESKDTKVHPAHTKTSSTGLQFQLSCLLTFVADVMVAVVLDAVQKVCSYVHCELELFDGIYEVRMDAKRETFLTEFIACIKEVPYYGQLQSAQNLLRSTSNYIQS